MFRMRPLARHSRQDMVKDMLSRPLYNLDQQLTSLSRTYSMTELGDLSFLDVTLVDVAEFLTEQGLIAAPPNPPFAW